MSWAGQRLEDSPPQRRCRFYGKISEETSPKAIVEASRILRAWMALARG